MTEIDPSYQSPVPPSLTLLLDALKREIKKEINCAKVGIVQSFDASDQTVTVQVAQQQVTSTAADGTRTLAEYPLLLKVPVYFPSGGGYTLTFPIAAGDECLVVFNDRELDNWFTSGPGLPPTTSRLHDLSDGIAFIGVRANPSALGNVSTTTTQLRSDDGETFIEVDGDGQIVTITAPVKVQMNTPILEVTGVVNVLNNDSEAEPFVVNGNINTNGDVIAGTISLKHHLHSGVTTGGGNTGQPV